MADLQDPRVASEAAGLAALERGELDTAEVAFAALEVVAAASGDGAAAGRALWLRGRVAHRRGQLGLASDRYREAAQRLGDAGDLAAAATAELDLGIALAERGRASDALPRLAAAARAFAERGAAAPWCIAELHRGEALLQLGQLEQARAAADAGLARSAAAPDLRATALIIAGDVQRRLGDEPGAIERYRESLALAAARGDARGQLRAHAALVEAGERPGDAVTLAAIDALCANEDDRDRWTLARCRLALRDPASLAARTPGSSATGSLADATAALARASAAVAMRAGDADRIERGFRGHALAAQLAQRARDAYFARAEAERARVAHAAWSAANAPAFRAAIDGDPDLARLPGGDPALSPAARAAPDPQLAVQRRLLALSRRLHAEASDAASPARGGAEGDDEAAAERSLRRILDEALDAAIELTGAERGCVLLRRAEGPLTVAAARHFLAGELDAAPGERPGSISRPTGTARTGEPMSPAHAAPGEPGPVPRVIADPAVRTGEPMSPAHAAPGEPGPVPRVIADPAVRTGEPMSPAHAAPGDARSVPRAIAERAARTGEPVMLDDAALDETSALRAPRLRSVLAVPLRLRGGAILGSLYVDHRLRGGAFDAAAAGALVELAEHAAIAVETARRFAELGRDAREAGAGQARLTAELAERDAELARIQAELPDRARLRHEQDHIVGRSPAMLRMLGVIDRAAATALPVVIVGEPGTGKTLVARALHDAGPRAAGKYVAIRCSAVPEPLLEGELFGCARGAAPGADRDRPGLFEIARGGTLFLDEIADTSPALQEALLRALQDGAVRRIGDAQARPIDVRVIAASQQPLAALAAAGVFRDDLRRRLDAITVPVPALRDRDGDLPLLIDHLLARLCAGRPVPRLTRAAVRALGQHAWPGNVRELEGALARGVAAGGDAIDVADLPEAIAQAAAHPQPARPAAGDPDDDLRLRPALAATERAYVAAAMARARGNQTLAARLLGLSRFGLQKKLRRLAGEDAGDDGDADDDEDNN